jgi:cytochrome c553
MNRSRHHDGPSEQGLAGSAMHVWTALALLAGAGAVQAQGVDVQGQRLRELAATCGHCHGTDGRAFEGEAFARLAGRPADELLAKLMAFRSGQRPATVMHQLTKGYTPEQLESVARYFAAQK